MLKDAINSPSKKTRDVVFAFFKVKNLSAPTLWYPPAH